ncbi:hypothetical protein [Prauserella cavernicola]|uniref:Uncharacterized protein n=1 Tax=Prauserella cavernicola TaxID=2800127 RepID=A0A934QUH5_9PSEU|nr:hypothetical protein [Prauserella cavernicola]MBK1785588.1 hypothetical protein [Prauserella cavernicola]
MHEIQAIITAANTEYQRFIATRPDRETRDAVSNAVKFLTADLRSAAALVATTQKGT